jgi:hypothetical protein
VSFKQPLKLCDFIAKKVRKDRDHPLKFFLPGAPLEIDQTGRKLNLEEMSLRFQKACVADPERLEDACGRYHDMVIAFFSYLYKNSDYSPKPHPSCLKAKKGKMTLKLHAQEQQAAFFIHLLKGASRYLLAKIKRARDYNLGKVFQDVAAFSKETLIDDLFKHSIYERSGILTSPEFNTLDSYMKGRGRAEKGVWGKKALPWDAVDDVRVSSPENLALMRFEVDITSLAAIMRWHGAIDSVLCYYQKRCRRKAAEKQAQQNLVDLGEAKPRVRFQLTEQLKLEWLTTFLRADHGTQDNTLEIYKILSDSTDFEKSIMRLMRAPPTGGPGQFYVYLTNLMATSTIASTQDSK